MSRNSKKLNRTPDPDYTPQEKENKRNKFDISNLSNMSFVASTDEVELPSQGKFYKKTSPLFEAKTVEIKHMTAKEEDLISGVTNQNDSNMFDKLIDSILVNKDLDSSMLLEEDKMAILLKARETGYGKEYKTPVYCTNCGHTGPASFDLSKKTIKPPTVESSYDPDNDCFEYHLEMMGADVKIRKLSSEDKQEINKEKEKKESLGIEFNYTISFIKKCLISFEGVTDGNIINKVVELMPARDAKSIMDFEANCAPSLDTTQEIECEKCKTTFEREVPFSWAFFRTDI